MNDFVQRCRSDAYYYIRENLEKYGHFPLFDFYPEYEEKKHLGWHYMYRSPFVHVSVLDSLLNAGYGLDDDMVSEAIRVLLEFREPGNLWRFWNVNEAEYPTFSDVDETSISSFALRKVGVRVNNKKILYSQIKPSGEVLTWINANLKVFLINPYVYFWLKYQNRKVMPILNDLKWITLDDAEPTIAANVVAYLGENKKTKSVVEYVINCWYFGCEDMFQHYDRTTILAFHIARAYKEGVKGFEVLKGSIIDFIIENNKGFSFPELLLGYLSISYFDGKNSYLSKLASIITNEVSKKKNYWEPFPYTTEKKKIYYGGGGTLTAAWFLEVTKDWYD